MSILSLSHLKTQYRTSAGQVNAVDGVSLRVDPGEIVGLAGESGCGKSTIINSIVRVLPSNAYIIDGKIQFRELNLTELDTKALRTLRWRDISIVPQSAMDALDPVLRIGKQFIMVARNSDRDMNRKTIETRAMQLFSMVGLSPKRLRDYPHQFSGGMKQRVIIALSLFFEPSLILMDEPVTALDVIVQNQILNHIQDLRQRMNLSILFVTHDVSVLAKICDRIYIMYAGKVVETGKTRDLLKNPLHPYTIGLKRSFPNLYHYADRLVSIPGSPPNLLSPPSGCRFYERCPMGEHKCVDEEPEIARYAEGRYVACHYTDRITDQFREKAFFKRAN